MSQNIRMFKKILFLLFFETTIMGNTADLAMVQKTIIDTRGRPISVFLINRNDETLSEHV